MLSCLFRQYHFQIHPLSIQFSSSVVSNSLRAHEPQHARPPCLSPTPGVHPNPCSLCRWCHPTISSFVIPSSSSSQSFPASGSFQMSQLSASGGQSIGVSASTSVPPMNTQDWFLLGWTSWISLQSKGLSRVFSNTTVQKHPLYPLTKIFWHKISLSGSSVHGILQSRILEWVSILFSRGIFLTQGLNSSPALQADSLPFETPGKPQDMRKKDQNWVKSMK